MKFPQHPIYSEGFQGTFPLFQIGWSPTPAQLIPRWRPVVENPVPLAFLPFQACRVDDRKEHEGVCFQELWADPVARTLWLAHKRFMITSQYFRLRCIQAGKDLRRRPERLLEQRLWLNIEYVNGFADDTLVEIGSQLGPFCVWALQREGNWPYLRVPGQELRWKYVKPGKSRGQSV